MTRKLSRHAFPEGRLTEAQYVTALERTRPLLTGCSRAPITHMMVEAYVLGLRDAGQIQNAPKPEVASEVCASGQAPGGQLNV